MPEPIQPEKAIVTVAELARTLGLSRSRFYQLVTSGVFPVPKRNADTQRPFYDVEGQQACLEVRRRNCGVNGQPILFYCRHRPLASPSKRQSLSAQTSSARKRKTIKPPMKQASQTNHLVDGLRQLGLDDLTDSKVAAALHACFPQGVEGTSEQDVLLAVFRYLSRQNSGGNVGR